MNKQNITHTARLSPMAFLLRDAVEEDRRNDEAIARNGTGFLKTQTIAEFLRDIHS